MANVTIDAPLGFDITDFWVANSTVSQNEEFADQQSSTGNPILGAQTIVYSEFTFTVGSLTYTYTGQWTVEFNRGVTTGTVRASGYYDSVTVEDAGVVIASYTGDQTAVDFGEETNIPIVDLVNDNILPLLLDGGDPTNNNPENLYLDSTPNLPALVFDQGDTMVGGDGPDTLSGYNGNDTLTGGDNNDVLNGGNGTDTMTGGLGDDRYYVSSAADVVNETAGQGNDTIITGSSYTLHAGLSVETLRTMGSASTTAINLTGNELANHIEGNAAGNQIDGRGGADAMYGFAGDDRYLVDNTNDTVTEMSGGGNDTVITRVSYSLAPGAEVELLRTYGSSTTDEIDLTGSNSNNALHGNAADNVINGGGGADTMIGFAGDDRYIVDNANDVVMEYGGGADTVIAMTSFALAAGSDVELLRTAGSASSYDCDLTGNEIANTLVGNAGDNVLDGGTGGDRLIGFAGDDIFQFSTGLGAGNVDTIDDFNVFADTIALDNAVFTGLAPGALAPGAFHIGSGAADADDRIIYNSTTGALSYDSNGSAANGSQVFAILDKGLALTTLDFVVV